jgi:hypothetical protein
MRRGEEEAEKIAALVGVRATTSNRTALNVGRSASRAGVAA